MWLTISKYPVYSTSNPTIQFHFIELLKNLLSFKKFTKQTGLSTLWMAITLIVIEKTPLFSY